MEKKRVVIIGSGNVATHLGRGLREVCNVLQIYSRTQAHAAELACELGVASAVSALEELCTEADIYILAVSDDAIAPIVAAVPDNGALWLHTAGSVDLAALQAHRRRCGVLYPMQSFTRSLPVNWREVPLFVEGCNREVAAEVHTLADLLSLHVRECDSRQRMALHVAAVFACNFANQLWTEAAEVLEAHSLNFQSMLPLIGSTVTKLGLLAPREAQTGPARRGDTGVMSRHLAMLSGTKRDIYQLMSHAIMQSHQVDRAPDFSRIRGVAFDVDGVLSPSTIPMHPSGEPMRMVNIKDGYAIQLAVKLGLPLVIISGARVEAVRVRFAGLGMTDIYLGAAHKLPVFRQWLAQHGLQAHEVAFVGDDIPDLPVMHEAGLAVAPADACPEVLEAAHHIAPCLGGQGVARYVIECILKAQGKWLHSEKAFGW